MENSIAKKYLEARKLNAITDDPESNPFKSKYRARKLLQDIEDEIYNELENLDNTNLV